MCHLKIDVLHSLTFYELKKSVSVLCMASFGPRFCHRTEQLLKIIIYFLTVNNKKGGSGKNRRQTGTRNVFLLGFI